MTSKTRGIWKYLRRQKNYVGFVQVGMCSGIAHLRYMWLSLVHKLDRAFTKIERGRTKLEGPNILYALVFRRTELHRVLKLTLHSYTAFCFCTASYVLQMSFGEVSHFYVAF